MYMYMSQQLGRVLLTCGCFFLRWPHTPETFLETLRQAGHFCWKEHTHRGQPQHRELHPLLFSNSVWVFNVPQRTYVPVKVKLQHPPPGQPPGHLNFWKCFVQMPPSPGQKGVQMPHHRSISGDQMPHPRENYRFLQTECIGFTEFHATILKYIPYIHSIIYTPIYQWLQMY